MGKGIPRLEEVCLRQVAQDVVLHAKVLKECELDSAFFEKYELAHHVLACRLLQTFESIQHEYRDREHWKLEIQKNLRHCLNFLVNRHTPYANFAPFRRISADSIETFLPALSRCEELKILQMKHTAFPKHLFLLSLPQWRNLSLVDLLNSSCDDQMFTEIVENCRDIQILRLTGDCITNKALFYLCKNQGRSMNFRFCKSNCECCSLGKKLTCLIVYGTKIDHEGLTCALQHLPYLKQLEDGFLLLGPGHLSGSEFLHVYNAIGWLRKAYESRNQPVPQLRLKTLFIPEAENYSRWRGPTLYYQSLEQLPILECCPNLERILLEVADASSTEIFSLNCFPSLKTLYLNDHNRFLEHTPRFHEFLTTVGHQLNTVSLSANDIMTLRVVKTVLRNCSNLKQFHLGRKKCFSRIPGRDKFFLSDEDDLESDATEVLNNAKNLEKISFRDILICGLSTESFLSNMITAALNVKALTICGTLVEWWLKIIMQGNNFGKLQEISLCNANLANVSLEPILKGSTNLSKITYSECQNDSIFSKKHKILARKYNFQLDIRPLEKRNSSKVWTVRSVY